MTEVNRNRDDFDAAFFEQIRDVDGLLSDPYIESVHMRAREFEVQMRLMDSDTLSRAVKPATDTLNRSWRPYMYKTVNYTGSCFVRDPGKRDIKSHHYSAESVESLGMGFFWLPNSAGDEVLMAAHKFRAPYEDSGLFSNVIAPIDRLELLIPPEPSDEARAVQFEHYYPADAGLLTSKIEAAKEYRADQLPKLLESYACTFTPKHEDDLAMPQLMTSFLNQRAPLETDAPQRLAITGQYYEITGSTPQPLYASDFLPTEHFVSLRAFSAKTSALGRLALGKQSNVIPFLDAIAYTSDGNHRLLVPCQSIHMIDSVRHLK